ncbi:hypothetical protein SLEP1_g20559 [Rubroshorea leprosula]|uniref:Leucine-rich repeat-containing N-terminal plant-type domain-containing protein n=1 Tax=Rubroshorea leprosula TaxID=152421 RepID=A0AAV5J335_9ROSI|nr:hypothetical protein SLEP1_g20559 [Rubroshorea leprosula]
MARLIFLFLAFLVPITNVTIISICNGNFVHAVCIESEKEALLKFKQGIVDRTNRLASWHSDGDCCRWTGIVCDNVTGHVIEINLRVPAFDGYLDEEAYQAYMRSRLGGKISPSLLHLKYLSHLDLSNNGFEGIHIPKFFGSLRSLRYLNLSLSNFGGKIPHHLGNLSNLKYLDLGKNYYNGPTMHVETLHWLSSLLSLEYLDLSYVNLSQASNWFHALNTLPYMVELRLSLCQLPHKFHPIASVNLSSLATLSLSENFLQSLSMINWVFCLKNLISLDLSDNDIEGLIPYGLRNLTALKHLDLSYNSFNSSIPNWLYNFTPLESLNLRRNLLQGEISSDIGKMNFVVELDLSFNSFEDQIPIRSIGNLCNLRSFSLSGTNLNLDISDVLKVFSKCVSNKLESLFLYKCQLYGQLTNQLGNFKILRKLGLSINSISGSIPTSIGELSSLKFLDLSRNKFKGNLSESFGQLSNLEVVDISHNFLEGTLSEKHFFNLTKLLSFIANGNPLILKVDPAWIPPFQIQELSLRSWHLGPQFPHWLSSQKHLQFLDISNSRISCILPSCFLNLSPYLTYLNLAHNQVHGLLPIISSFNNPLSQIFSSLHYLDLSNNFLSGSLFNFLCHGANETMNQMYFLNLGNNFLSEELPNCWFKWPNLEVIVLDNNRFIGKIPSSIGTLQYLESLHFRKNNLSGEIPISIRNCTSLQTLDFGENELAGNIPSWIGHNLPYLTILSLRSNKFSGHIPRELCALNFLHVLDVAHNSLSRSLPSCISNLSAMVYSVNGSFGNYITYHSPSIFIESVLLVMKGQFYEYDWTLNLVRALDLSDNNLSRGIPWEITKLQGLQSLNLSHNHFTKRIPPYIGDMSSLESLDLSVNKLLGSIPESMSRLSFLSHLNLSDNQLTGKIPSSTQLQSFNASCFVGNKLCGLPLPHNCSEATHEEASTKNSGGKDMDGIKVNWLLVSMALGFIFGFWSLLSPLVISRQWRHSYYQYLDEMGWKVSNYVSRFF